MKTLTVAFITSRLDPKIDWFLTSLFRQLPGDCDMDVLIIDGYGARGRAIKDFAKPTLNIRARIAEPKPTIWSGPHRITKEDWWSKSNALNTAICLCETPWIAFVDDRCVLSPAWIYCVEAAMTGNYAVCGNYEKHANMVVTNGEIIEEGRLLGKDNRTQSEYPHDTKDWYGGSYALPVQWCLAVNGHPELCDGLGLEDAMFGCLLHNSGYQMRYDPRMLIIQDRTPGEIDGGLKRADKGTSPDDKSHKIVELLRHETTSQNCYDIRNLRDRILSGESFPPSCMSHIDWYDQKPISEMV